MKRIRFRIASLAATAGALALLGACAGLPAAQMALPAELNAVSPEPVQGIGWGRQGEFTVGRDRGTFTRGKDRLEIFEVVLSGQPRPFSFECAWTGAVDAHLRIEAPSPIPGTRAERRGRFRLGDVTIDIRSVHDVQGSRLPLEAPIGYLLVDQGKAVGAIELNGTTPRLWRPSGPPLAEPVTLAALALALLWDPADGMR